MWRASCSPAESGKDAIRKTSGKNENRRNVRSASFFIVKRLSITMPNGKPQMDLARRSRSRTERAHPGRSSFAYSGTPRIISKRALPRERAAVPQPRDRAPGNFAQTEKTFMDSNADEAKQQRLTRIAPICANLAKVVFHSRQFAQFASRSGFVPVLSASICVHLRFRVNEYG